MFVADINAQLRAALSYQRLRVEVASYNLALANVALKPGVADVFTRSLSAHMSLTEASSVAHTNSSTNRVLDASHPYADSAGFVHYPRVDSAHEMATLVSATRAYEADIRAYNCLRLMSLKAFDIGK